VHTYLSISTGVAPEFLAAEVHSYAGLYKGVVNRAADFND